MRGRSEATSLARCRAQIEHRVRDGRRIDVSPDRRHIAHSASDIDDQRATHTQHLAASLRAERVQFADQDVPARTGPDRPDNVGPDQRAYLRHDHAALPAADTCTLDSDISTDSHGVSDPSGHARGHFQRAHRGRSRHGFLL